MLRDQSRNQQERNSGPMSLFQVHAFASMSELEPVHLMLHSSAPRYSKAALGPQGSKSVPAKSSEPEDISDFSGPVGSPRASPSRESVCVQ